MSKSYFFKKGIISILLLMLPFLVKNLHAGWVNLNTGIDDNLTGVVFWGNYGMVSGHKGLYYTTTGGNGASNWNRYSITGNTADSLLYEHTRFYHSYADVTNNGLNQFYACGQDTMSGRAVIIFISFPSMTYNIVYTGNNGSILRRIGRHYQNGTYYAVGDNGLIVRFTNMSGQLITSPYNHNYTSIAFFNNNFTIGTSDYHVYGIVDGNNNLNFSSQFTPGILCNDLTYNSMQSSYKVGNSCYYVLNNNISEMPYYSHGPLNANTIVSKDPNRYFIGTDHGIYKSNLTFSYLEYQPSSNHTNIRSLWISNSNFVNALYACGENGTVLMSQDDGGDTAPLAYISGFPVGACKGTSVFISGSGGSSTYCQWKINGNYISNNCSGFSHIYTDTGTYVIQLFTTKPGYTDSASRIIHIVNTPKINKPVTINDSILCHSEIIQITVDSSENNVIYTLHKAGNSNVSYGSSGTGNGGAITFNSFPISLSGSYYIEASSILSPCSRNFTDTLYITVEQTTANFHSSRINANIGETVLFYEWCKDAQNFNWNFTPSASISNSSQPNPSVSFAATGNTQIQLICSSSHGCYDTLQKNGPNILIEPGIDSCWTLINRGTDPEWLGYYSPDISTVRNSSDGFFACGHFKNLEIFSSMYGDSASIPVFHGSYLESFSTKGTLRWIAYTKQPTNEFAGRDEMNDIVEDAQKNIYICGIATGYFYDNTGDSILIGDEWSLYGYIAKLDSNGKFIWKITTNYPNAFVPTKMEIDIAGNVLVIGTAGGGLPLYFNDVLYDTLTHNAYPGVYRSLLKLNSNGQLLWNGEIRSKYLNDITTDKAGYIYISGSSPDPIQLYPANSGQPIDLNGAQTFLAKYSPTGAIDWVVKGYASGSPNIWATFSSIAADSVGNCYITGTNQCGYNNDSIVVINANATVQTSNLGSYYLAKISSTGICQWIEGTYNCSSSHGECILIDGNNILVAGAIENSLPVKFSSSNDTSKKILSGISDYFINTYDSLGTLLSVTVNGYNMPPSLYMQYPNTLIKTNDSSYLFSHNASGSGPYHTFGSTISQLNGIDGIITKFQPACGIIYNPCFFIDSLKVVSCGPYVFSPSGHIYTQSGLYYDTLHTLSQACDTVYKLDIHITHFNNSIITDNNTLIYSSIDTGLSFQWFNCNILQPVAGATGTQFTATENGSYAVIISDSICTDTSVCTTLTIDLDIKDIDYTEFSIYPNPSNGQFTLLSSKDLKNTSFQFYDTLGKMIYSQDDLIGLSHSFNLPNLKTGCYTIVLRNEKINHIFRLIIQN